MQLLGPCGRLLTVCVLILILLIIFVYLQADERIFFKVYTVCLSVYQTHCIRCEMSGHCNLIINVLHQKQNIKEDKVTKWWHFIWIRSTLLGHNSCFNTFIQCNIAYQNRDTEFATLSFPPQHCADNRGAQYGLIFARKKSLLVLLFTQRVNILLIW